MATVRVNIARGYHPQVNAYVEGHPGIARDEAIQRWVEERYGSWIASNIGEQFTFENVDAQQFDVAFEDDDHAKQFQAALGGQVVTDGGR